MTENGRGGPRAMNAGDDPWDARAPRATGGVIGLEDAAGGVQFRGRRALALNDDVVTVPFAELFAMAGSLLVMMQTPTPQGLAIRAHIARYQGPGKPPASIV